jgi:acetyl esterase/lipase
MTLKRILRIGLLAIGGLLLICALTVGAAWWYLHPDLVRTDGVVYGQRRQHSLTLDVLRPTRANGLGVALMVSGGWKSGKPGSVPNWMAAPLLRGGYTVFAVCHVSQPESTVTEIFADVRRAIQFIRLHAADYGIDPARLGVTGGSAGGHLGLMLATRGGPGVPDASDPVERQSSAVQAVAIFYPVTDLLNLGKSTENPGDGGPPKSFVKAFGPEATNMAAWKVIGRDLSPIYHITSNLPPVRIHHGDADTLTPLEQSEWFQARAREFGRPVEIVIHPGGKHGWTTMLWDIRQFARWFDRQLLKSASPAQARRVAAAPGPAAWPAELPGSRRGIAMDRRPPRATCDQQAIRSCHSLNRALAADDCDSHRDRASWAA